GRGGAQPRSSRLAPADAKVGQPEVLLGIIPGAGGTQRLPRLCGAPLALEMCTDGKPVAAPKAKAAGILDEVVPEREGFSRADLLSAAVAFAADKVRQRQIRKTRDITRSPEQIKTGLEACQTMRQTL